MSKAYKYIVILKCIKYDFPAFMLFPHTNVQTSEGTFCRVEVHIWAWRPSWSCTQMP